MPEQFVLQELPADGPAVKRGVDVSSQKGENPQSSVVPSCSTAVRPLAISASC